MSTEQHAVVLYKIALAFFCLSSFSLAFFLALVFVESKTESRSRERCYPVFMSFREWLFEPIFAKIQEIMAKSLSDLNTAIAANTAETALAVAAISANTSGDFTPQVNAVSANTAALAAVVPNPTGPGTGPVTASPTLASLTAAAPTQSVTLTESNGQPNVFQAVSSNTAIATVAPASGPGPFTITRVGAGVGASVSFTDQQNNVATVQVSAV